MKCSSHTLTLTRCGVKGKVYKKTTVSTYFLYVLEPMYRVYAVDVGYTYVGVLKRFIYLKVYGIDELTQDA